MLGLLTPSLSLALVLRFDDCKSGRPIVLVGCMHYNPVSVALAEAVVREAAKKDMLGAVALETCPEQWERTLRHGSSGVRRPLHHHNEMEVAAEIARTSDCGLALVDQPIGVTSARLAQLCKLTAVDLASPLEGWQRVADDIAFGWVALQSDKPGGVGPRAFLAPKLLAGAPVALLRYLVASPQLAVTAIGAAAAVLHGGDAPPPTPGELLPYVAAALLESVLLARVLLVGLIEERNHVLARHIRAASMQVLTSPRAVRQRGRGKDGRAVVAVLGLAHLNGVKRLLTTSRAV